MRGLAEKLLHFGGKIHDHHISFATGRQSPTSVADVVRERFRWQHVIKRWDEKYREHFVVVLYGPVLIFQFFHQGRHPKTLEILKVMLGKKEAVGE